MKIIGNSAILSVLVSCSYSTVFAGTKVCSDPSASIRYHYSAPDGGAYRLPVSSWTINNKEYYPADCLTDELLGCPQGNEDKVLATFTDEIVLNKTQVGTPGEGGAFLKIIYTIKAKVVKFEEDTTGETLADTFLICQHTFHNGAPIP